MMGAENGQAPYLTADDGVYYIDTDSQAQAPSCVRNDNFSAAPFTAGSSYVVYQLFAKKDSTTTYQLYTGASPTGQWVWVQPHLTSASAPSNNMVVTPITDPTLTAALNAGVSVSDGVLQVRFDSSLIADQFSFAARDADAKCIPRDACQIGPHGDECVLSSSFAEPGLDATVGSICQKWATRVAGTTATSDGLSLSDCPASGCLGYSFTLPAGWVASPYAQSGMPLVTWFPQDPTWDRPLQVISQDSGICPAPPTPSGFCAAPTPTVTPPTDE
jgi:hypothetical protein